MATSMFLSTNRMSRKIGLCDVHFDPDIEGEIDFDFFNDGDEDDDEHRGPMTARTNDNDGVIKHCSTSKTATSKSYGYEDNRSTTTMSSRGAAAVGRLNHPDADDDEYARTMRELKLGLPSSDCDCLEDFEQHVCCSTMRDDGTSRRGGDALEVGVGGVRNIVATNLMAIDTPFDRMSDHADHHHHQQQQPVQTAMERSLTPKELLRVTATELRFGSPQSSDSGSDSASDLYSLTDSLTDEDQDPDNNSLDVASDSEITDVSPLSSANMSPLPESPRRRTPEPSKRSSSSSSSSKFGSFSPRPGGVGRRSLSAAGLQCCNGGPNASGTTTVVGFDANSSSTTTSCSKQSSVDLKLLAKAILELEEERKINKTSSSSPSERDVMIGVVNRSRSKSSSLFGHDHQSSSLGRMSSNSGRKNLSFSNDEIRRIELENKRLLRRIIDSQKTRRSSQPPPTTGKLASSAVNRMRELKKIEAENLAMLKRLQAAKPTKELSRDFLLKAGNGRSGSACSQQCGACSTPASMSSPNSSQSGSSSQQQQPQRAATGRHGTNGRSLSTGSLTSTLASCSSTSNRCNYAGRSRSLKLPNTAVAVTTGFVRLGQQASAAAAGGGGSGR